MSKVAALEAASGAPMMSQGPASKALSPLFRTRNSRGKAGHRGSAGCGWQLFHFCRHTLVCFADLMGRSVWARQAPPPATFFIEILISCNVG